MKNWQLLTFIFFVGGTLMIPVTVQDVFAETFDITIPQDANNPKNPVHFLYSELTVSVEDKIRWINFDTVTHTVTSGSFQGGPDGVFNSGLLENSEVFSYEINSSDIGILSYYCTIHPWMNGFLNVLDPEGLPVGQISQTGSIEAAQSYVDQARSLKADAEKFAESIQHTKSGEAFSVAANYYHKAALEYALLNDHNTSALHHKLSADLHYASAIQYEKIDNYKKSIGEHFEAGVHHHFAAIQYDAVDDEKSRREQLSKSLLHKGMAKFGSDYILPPKHQARFMDIDDMSCKEGFELVLKSTTKDPSCIKYSSVEKLSERGWAIKIPN